MRHHPYKLYGVLLLLVASALVALSVMAFNRDFTPADYVTVHINRAGLQLLPGSDVKERGLIVGSVDSISSTGKGADLKLRLTPSDARKIPANVTVRLLPKTLFGEKYVDLVPPAQPSGRYLADGAVIDEDQTRPTLEIDQALDDLLPTLRAVPPADLNRTLTALATALSGRGDQLGATIQDADAWLRDFNPHLPQLQHDMAALATFSHTYADAAPALLRMLGNLTVTSRTVVEQQQQISAFLDDVTGAADATHDLLARNADNLIAVNKVNRPVLSLLARYSPEFPCFFKGYAGLIPRIHDAVAKSPVGISHSAHVVVEVVPSFPTYQYPIDLPQFNDKRGPNCYGLPHPPMSLPVIRYKDGTEDDPRFDGQGGQPGKSSRSGGLTGKLGGLFSPSMGIAGTGEERTVFDRLLGPMLGIDAGAVPDIADLLWGPLARGQAVNIR
ncbi:MAG TPA: MCE family protein [Mycobacteriales bacterium]|jgi:phospholipid/cholesterol/gamma-HCH transport system substrate-binding protein|nr:MCE family protein [Mycobacteriales bacterium]